MLSVVINTKNAAETLEETLKSVENLVNGVGGEIIVVDAKSSDETVEIAKNAGAQIYLFEEEFNFVEPARQFALDKATRDWILVLDADEEITTELGEKIRQIVSQQSSEDKQSADAYLIARQNIIFNKALENTGWYPDYQLRLFRKGKVTWPKTLHAVPEVNGEVERLSAAKSDHLAIIHHNYQTIDQYWQRALRYSSIQADQQPSATQGNEMIIANQKSQTEIFWQTFWGEYWRRLFADHGLDDGAHGLVLSFFQATSELMVAAKIWERQKFPQDQLTASEWQKIWQTSQREFNYWRANYLIDQTTGFNKLVWQIRRKLKI